MFRKPIIELNDHWSNELYDDGVKRSCFGKMIDFLDTDMIISICGVRRAGKSILMKQTINYLINTKNVNPKNILFLNLEHPYFSKYRQNIENLQLIYENYLKIAKPSDGEVYLFLDEIQFFDEWEIFVKAIYEQKKCKIIISGSNSSLLSSDLLTLLSGRTLPIEVYPFSFFEIASEHKLITTDLLEQIKNETKLNDLLKIFLKDGGFPQVFFEKKSSIKHEILNAYAKTILFEDVATRLHLRKPKQLEQLFVYLISHIGKKITYNKVAKLLNLDDKSIKEYIKALEDSYLLFELPLFSFSLKKQIANSKKIYSIDTGQVNSVSFKFSENLGRIFENFIFLEFKRNNYEIFYYQSNNDLEVDFIVKKHTKLSPIQVSWTIENFETKKREINSLIQCLKELNLPKGFIITSDYDEDLIIEKKQIKIISASKFLILQNKDKLLFE
jgi:uncharacterized protein